MYGLIYKYKCIVIIICYGYVSFNLRLMEIIMIVIWYKFKILFYLVNMEIVGLNLNF